MSEKQNKNVTVRVQKIKKNHIKQKLVIFSYSGNRACDTCSFFQSISVHMTLMHRIWQVHFSPPVFSILWEQIHMGEICCPEL